MTSGATLEAQRRSWDEDGYVFLPKVLSSREVDDTLRGIDRLIDDFYRQKDGAPDTNVERDGIGVKILQAIGRTDLLDPLLDHPNTFGSILALGGPYIQVMGSEVLVRPRSDEHLVQFHTDGGPSLRRILPRAGNLPLQFKIQFFLTDVSRPDRGNLMLVPGSHLRPMPEPGFRRGEIPEGAIQVMAEPGDAIVFLWSIWHGVAPNLGDEIRRTIILRYGQMWCRPADYEKLPESVLTRLTPRRRRLLGDLGDDCHPSEYYKPYDRGQIETMLGTEYGEDLLMASPVGGPPR